MTDLCDPAAVRRLLEENGLAPRKAFGQNFLINPAIPAEIAEVSAAAPFFWEENRTEGTCALEIGPGLGALTRELAARYAAVTAVEIDRGLIPVLAGTLADCPNAEIVEADFMKTDVPALLSRFGGKPVHVAGNLPYYITTPILMRLLESYPADGSSPIRRITLMVQKEVADRLAASPGSKDYGVLTVTVTYYCEVKKVLDVGKEAFIPSPKVDSAVVQLTPKGDGRVRAKDDGLFFRLVKAGFSQRRKTLINALTGGGFGKEEALAAMEAAGIDPKRRAETLSVADFVRLSDAMGG